MDRVWGVRPWFSGPSAHLGGDEVAAHGAAELAREAVLREHVPELALVQGPQVQQRVLDLEVRGGSRK